MTPDEVGQTIRKADRERDKVLIAVFYITGARVSEIINLQRNDFTIKKNELVVSVEPRKRGDSGSPLRKYNNLIFDREKTPFIDTIVKTISWISRETNSFSKAGKEDISPGKEHGR